MATGGFSWQPQWDEKSQQLKPRADPEWRLFRKKLKEKAPWASQIIVATDPDPAGSFISYSISRFLKGTATRRTYIHSLSAAGIKEAIEESFPVNDQESAPEIYGVLRNRYLILQSLTNSLKAKLGHNPWIKLVLLRLFSESFPFTNLIGQNGVLQLTDPIHCRYNDEIIIKESTGDYQPHKTVAPLNTASFLELLQQNGHKMSDNQDSLNRLFTSIPQELGTGLISYPRTSASGYYRKTWEQSYQFWIKKNDAETFLPNVLWGVISDQTPHESLRPIEPSITPSEVRPLIRKKLYDIYTRIHNHFISSISAQNIKSVERSILHNGRSLCETGIIGDHHLQETFRTMISISDLLHTMNAYGASRPSGFGKLYDRLISEKWISESGKFVSPGETFYEKQVSQPFQWKNWLDDLTELMNNPAVEVSKLKSTLDRMIHELPL